MRQKYTVRVITPYIAIYNSRYETQKEIVITPGALRTPLGKPGERRALSISGLREKIFATMKRYGTPKAMPAAQQDLSSKARHHAWKSFVDILKEHGEVTVDGKSFDDFAREIFKGKSYIVKAITTVDKGIMELWSLKSGQQQWRQKSTGRFITPP